jgi:hypothetical protein
MDEMMGLREYRETVGNDWDKGKQQEQGKYAGAGTGEKQSAPVDGKSPVSSGKGKPVSGAKAIATGKGASSNEDGTKPHGKAGGLAGNVKGEFTKGVEKNIAGSSKTSMKDGAKLEKQGSGYPGNNKTPGPVGSGTGDKAGQTSVGSVKSPINGAPNRNA